MKRIPVVTIALVLSTGSAIAQPQLGDPEEPTAIDPAPPPVDPEPPPPPPPPPAAADPAPTTTSAPRGARPVQHSVGVGLGWFLPADLQAPNTTSVRFRLASGLTVEPRATLSKSSTSFDDGTPPDISTSVSEVSFGVLVRVPLINNGKADFEAVAGASLSRVNTDPDMADNDTLATSMSLGYGLAVGYWITPHFQLSMTALNGIFIRSTEVQEMGPGVETTSTSSSFGAVFDPNVLAMLHLYF